MSGVFNLYFLAGGMTLFAKIFAALASIAEIYFLNTLLGKDGYGSFVYAFTIIIMVSIMIGRSANSLILYKLSSTADDVFKSDFFRSVCTIALVLSCLACFILYWTVSNIWIVALCFLIPFEILRVLFTSALQARQNIPAFTFYNVIFPYALRIIALVILFLQDWNDPHHVVLGYGCALFIPLFILMIRHKIMPSLAMKALQVKDFLYWINLSLTQLVHQNARYLDLIIIGTIGLATATAEYAVALKFGAFLLLGKQLTQSLLTPRMTQNSIGTEYASARFFGLLTAACGAIGFGLIGSFILPYFGDYETVETLFYLVAAAMVARVITGSSAEFLSMKGHVGWILWISVVTLLATSVTAFFLIPHYGAVGSGIAAIVGSVVSNALLFYAAIKTERFVTTSVIDFIFGFMIMLLSILIGLSLFPLVNGLIAMTIITGLYLYRHRKDMMAVFNMVKMRKKKNV